ncbi:MAG: imelysin family protein [Marivibrio sp.]|uniref:imelysin family protein n=1 Tax=Marivibrio sp. TaxID=2039719 RepID=UPI0032ECCA78
MRRRAFLAGALALPGAWSLSRLARAETAANPSSDLALRIAQAAIDRVLIPDYQVFAETAAAFAETADAPGAALHDLRAGYHAAMDAWQAVQAVRIGPIAEEERHFRVQFWPDKRNLTARHLGRFIAAADEEALAPERFAAYSIAVQGFPALERLLFEDADTLSTAGEEADFRRRLVAAIARNLAAIGAAVMEEWPAHRTAMLNPGPDNAAYRDAGEVLRALHGALAGGLEAAILLKLNPVLGDRPEAMRPRLAESWRADRSLRNLSINLAAARRLFYGAGADPHSMAAVLRAARQSDAADRIQRGLRDAEARAARIGPAFADALAQEGGYVDLVLLRDQIASARGAVEGDLAAALGLTMGFNALDGD